METKKINSILVVIDAQNDFVYGSLENDEAKKAVPIIAKTVKMFANSGRPIIFTQDTHSKETYLKSQEGRKLTVEHCLFGTIGWEIADEVFNHIDKLHTPYRVCYKEGFGYQKWKDNYTDCYLKDADYIFICGFCTDICVITNALLLKTYYPEAEIIVLADCCAGTTPENHRMALEVMKSCQIEVMFDELEVKEGRKETAGEAIRGDE